MNEHQSVMRAEAITALNIKPNGIYLDATFGRGGHTLAILSKLNSEGRVFVMDKDLEAIKVAKVLQLEDTRISVIQHDSFANLAIFCRQQNLIGKLDGILFDLGVCSTQLDCCHRGFSFLRDGPLDMRMDQSRGITAASWINNAKEEEIIFVLKTYGEERFAKKIAKKILQYREQVNPITTTGQLANIISQSIPSKFKYKEKHKHPATRSFQAIRIFINNELEDLTRALNDAVSMLSVGGRLVVISFHSLEDRIVKKFIADNSKSYLEKHIPRKLPIMHKQLQLSLLKNINKIKPNEIEIKDNIRARSAILRVAEKVIEQQEEMLVL